MAAPKGNKFYLLRSKDGRDKEYPTPDDLWRACCKYFEYVEKNPLKEQKAFSTSNGIVKTTITKKRAMTLAGLYVRLGISETTYLKYRKEKDFLWVISAVDNIMYSQKFEGAAAGLLNPNIIARDLGLRDKKEFTGPNGGPVIAETNRVSMDPKEYARVRKQMLKEDDC